MKKALQFLRKNPEINFFICAFILWTALMCYENTKEGGDFKWHDLKVEANGMIFDLFVFGILVTTYNAIRARKEKIERLKEEIDDYKGWDEKEAMYRIVGAIKRLNNLGVTELNLNTCFLEKAPLNGINLSGSCFDSANINEANFAYSNLSRADFGFFPRATLVNFINANLSEADLRQNRFTVCFFGGADLSGANLYESTLSECDLPGANLSGANLARSTLSKCSLSGANLSGANLSGSTLSECSLSGANLENTFVGLNWFNNIKAWQVRGYEEIVKNYFVDVNGILKVQPQQNNP